MIDVNMFREAFTPVCASEEIVQKVLRNTVQQKKLCTVGEENSEE